MSTVREELQQALRASRNAIVEGALALEGATAHGYSHTDIEQMADATLALMNEALDLTDLGVRRTYLETVIPALVARGQAPESLLGNGVGFHALVVSEVVPRIAPERRGEVVRWLVAFETRWFTDLAKVAFDAASSARRAPEAA